MSTPPSGGQYRWIALAVARSIFEYTPDHVDILPVILPYSARWEYIKLHVDLSDLLPIQRPKPLLRELDFQAPFDCVPAFPAAFYEVLRLRVATLWDFRYPTTLLPEIAEPMYIGLEQTVNLVYCELVLLDYDALPEPDTHLPHLESLILMHFRFDDPPATVYLDSFIKYFLRRIPWANCPHFSQNPGAI
ncbi:hypothetical protein B0H13DRAFT_2329286 [Mycena leptocephala]|nr:hypothetical protein B0H13DRAFT_2329286 [Mycena leptocephala]